MCCLAVSPLFLPRFFLRLFWKSCVQYDTLESFVVAKFFQFFIPPRNNLTFLFVFTLYFYLLSNIFSNFQMSVVINLRSL